MADIDREEAYNVFHRRNKALTIKEEAPSGTPAAHTMYKHRNAGGQFEVPLAPGLAVAALAGVLTDDQGGLDAGDLEDWHEVGATGEPGFSNSFDAYTVINSTTQQTDPAFRKMPDGTVRHQGLVDNASGTSGTATVYRAPPGYRPLDEMQLLAERQGDPDTTYRILIAGQNTGLGSHGDIIVVGYIANQWLSLDNVSYIAGA